MCVSACVPVYVCVRAGVRVYIYMCVCVCVCVRVRVRASEGLVCMSKHSQMEATTWLSAKDDRNEARTILAP